MGSIMGRSRNLAGIERCSVVEPENVGTLMPTACVLFQCLVSLHLKFSAAGLQKRRKKKKPFQCSAQYEKVLRSLFY